jgi:UDP-4-amino-4,6-dideoxy-N-acetyl-beta-L-altrosamine transaminase
MKMIPYGHHSIGEDDIRAVVRVLRSGWITQGPKVGAFEKALCQYVGSKYAVAVSSGTAALHLACLAAGIKPGDEVIISPITFVASANCVLYCGARPVFADIRADTANIDPDEIKKAVTRKTKAVIPVHFAGYPCDMGQISRIAKNHRLIVIEDGSHALGARYRLNGRWHNVGSNRHSDMTVFSFHPVKGIATGEGGVVTTNNKKFYERLVMLRSHGITKNPVRFRFKAGRREPWYQEMQCLGYNYRLTDFQCALGISQLKKLNEFLRRRRRIAGMYDKAFANIKGLTTVHGADRESAHHLYILKIDFKKFRTTRKKFMGLLRKKGILAQVHYIPVYHQPFYRDNGLSPKRALEKAEEYYRKTISIPIYPVMTEMQVRKVINTVKGSLK